MNTASHILIGAAILGRPSIPAITLGAMAGGLVPDLPMFAMVMWSTLVLGLPGEVVFGQRYFSEAWQTVFSIDHGFLVWGSLFAFAVWHKLAVLHAFAGAGILHALADFLTHHDDARRQFWPLSKWVFNSPVSYWDVRHYGAMFAPFEAGVVIVLSMLLILRLQRGWERALILTIAAAVIVTFLLTGSLHGMSGMG